MRQGILARVELPHEPEGPCLCAGTRLDVDFGIAAREQRSPACVFVLFVRHHFVASDRKGSACTKSAREP